MTTYPLLLVVACALIKPASSSAGGNVLLAKRPKGKSLAGMWEFPGGKLEEGECPELALKRELKEELNIDISESDLAPLTFASYSYEKFHLLMPLYSCKIFTGDMKPCEGQTLEWVSAAVLANDYKKLKNKVQKQDSGLTASTDVRDIVYPLPPADIAIMPAVLNALGLQTD